jgi:diguanylate cyclase
MAKSKSTVHTKELLKHTLSFIGIHRLSANPVNYTVCYEYLLGNQPLLKQAIDKSISGNIPLTDEIMGHCFESFLSGFDQVGRMQMQDDLIEVISKVTESATLAEDSFNQYDKALSHSEKELIDSSTSLESIIAELLDSTSIMQASMELMRQQIQASKQEINFLQDRLAKASQEVHVDPLKL